jgi:uncharacterized protein YbcI
MSLSLSGHRSFDGTLDIAHSPMLELSNAVVRLYKEVIGRGPTKARATFAGNDTLVVVLEYSLTVAERSLVALGEHERVRATRLRLQDALEPELRALVEGITGRRPIARITGVDPQRDVAVELFTFEPAPREATG